MRCGTVLYGVGVWPVIVSSSHSALARADNICRRSPYLTTRGDQSPPRLVRPLTPLTIDGILRQRVATRAFNYWLFLRPMVGSMLIWHDVWKTVGAVANRCPDCMRSHCAHPDCWMSAISVRWFLSLSSYTASVAIWYRTADEQRTYDNHRGYWRWRFE